MQGKLWMQQVTISPKLQQGEDEANAQHAANAEQQNLQHQTEEAAHQARCQQLDAARH